MTDNLKQRLRIEGDGVMSRREKTQIADLIEQLEAERNELKADNARLREAATLLLSRKRPNATEDTPRLILEIDCLNLQDALANGEKND